MTQINSQNVICQVRGTEQPDSVIIVSAHYDHLGMQGSSIFPGANDNASGTSMLLSMVEYFVKHPQRYTMVFIAFGAEETGLIGSNYYVNRSPVVALSQTRFILNIDLMGNGIDGITAVGGRDFPNYFERLVALNDTMQSVPKLKSRSNAPNSDHYFFLKNGVPGFFIYTLGGPPHYHDINDNPSTIVLSRYAEVRELLIKYLELLNA
ncbi:MAG: M28 family peptidase [Bacteroidota bacterium]